MSEAVNSKLNIEVIQQQKKIIDSYKQLNKFKKEIDINRLTELKELAYSFERDSSNALTEGRLLRIGIIGQLKRGKSSFLNTLLFNGKDILPKAATPMTAALTKISYSEQPSASIEFYNKADWTKIENTVKNANETIALHKKECDEAKESQKIPPILTLSSEQKSCIELANMVKENNISLNDYLGSVHEISGVSDVSVLVNKLNDFVGANGKFTPIVKSTELKLNIESLKGVEIVDTPGMNDPIISRGQKTQEFIGQCDAVFFLSYCGQFLDINDIGLLAQNIPNKGVEEIFLIGSLFDSVLLDCYSDYNNIGEAVSTTLSKLNDQAQKNVNSVIEAGNDNQRYLFTSLKKALPPIFISTRCLDLANKSTLNEEENHSLKQLNGMFSDFTFDKNTLEQVGNFSEVYEKIEDIKSRKEKILASKFNAVLTGYKKEITTQLEGIKADISLKLDNLQNGDLNQIQQRQKAIIKQVEGGEIKINATFDKHSIMAEKNLGQLKNEIANAASQAKRIDSREGTEQVEDVSYRTESASELIKPWTWGSTKQVRSVSYRSVSYTFANIQDTVNKLEDFTINANQQITSAIDSIINIQQFRNDIKAIIKTLFDFSDDSFDPEAILMPLENAVNRINIPKTHLDLTKHINIIRDQFSMSEVRDSEIDKLQREQIKVVELLIKEISLEVNKVSKNIIEKLEVEKQKFIPELTKDLHASVNQLEADLKDKKGSIANYQNALIAVNNL